MNKLENYTRSYLIITRLCLWGKTTTRPGLITRTGLTTRTGRENTKPGAKTTGAGAKTGAGATNNGAGKPKPKLKKTSVRAIDVAGIKRIIKSVANRSIFFIS
jgi:hypothetical protein